VLGPEDGVEVAKKGWMRWDGWFVEIRAETAGSLAVAFVPAIYPR
jgi:hypothetical protein